MKTRTCGAGYDDCDCDLVPDEVADALGLPRGHISAGCECHDCHCMRPDCEECGPAAALLAP